MAETETFVGASGELHDGTGFDLAWTKPGTDPANALLDAYDDGTVEGLGASADTGAGDTYYLAPTAQGTDAMAYGRFRDFSEAKQTPLCAKLQDADNYAAVDVAGTGSIGTRIEVVEAGVVDDGDVRWQGANDQWVKIEVDGSGNIEGFTGGTSGSPTWSSEGSHGSTAFGAETNQGLVCPSNCTTTFGSDLAKYYEITFDSLGGGGTTVSVDIGAGSLSFSGQSHTATAGMETDIGTGSLTLSGQSHAIAAGAEPDVGAGSLSFSGQTLTIAAGVQAAIGTGSLTFSGQALTVTTGAGVSVDIQPGTLSFSGQSLEAEHGQSVNMGVGSLSLSGLAQEISAGASVDVQVGTLTLTGQSAEAQGGVEISISPGSITLSGQAIEAQHGQSLDIGAGTLTLTGQSISITVVEVETPDGRTLTIPLESRTLKITAEKRTLTIPEEVRGLKIH